MSLKLSHVASAALSLLSSRGMRSILPSLSLPSSTGLALSAVDSTLWAARAYLFPSTAPAWHAQPALAGLESLPASSSADSAPLPSLLDTAVWTMNRNKREPRKANHGARPCSSVRRKRKYDTRANPHPYIPTSNLLRKKGYDY